MDSVANHVSLPPITNHMIVLGHVGHVLTLSDCLIMYFCYLKWVSRFISCLQKQKISFCCTCGQCACGTTLGVLPVCRQIAHSNSLQAFRSWISDSMQTIESIFSFFTTFSSFVSSPSIVGNRPNLLVVSDMVATNDVIQRLHLNLDALKYCVTS